MYGHIRPSKIANPNTLRRTYKAVTGGEYTGKRPIELLRSPAIIDELKRVGFTHAEARVCRFHAHLTIFELR